VFDGGVLALSSTPKPALARPWLELIRTKYVVLHVGG
jgi:hypothetical protein